MEGIAAVTARISEIQSLVRTLTAPPVAGTAQPPSTFARTLAEATTATASARRSAAEGMTPSGAAHLRRPPALGGVAPAGDPESLRVYGNGRVPTEVLMPLGVGTHRLSGPAAAAFGELGAAAKIDGVTFGVTDSYRSYDQQVDVSRRKGLYSEGGLAARPGTSDHGWGLSVDLDLNPKAQAWMRANAGRFGYAEDVPREPWHWTFKSA